jgi:membrane-bound serine protease (ClpP class)
MRARSVGWGLLLIMLGAVLLPISALAQDDGSQTIDLIELSGIIDPVTADYLSGRLEVSQEDRVHAAVIQIDTPGGLDVSMREMIQDILDSSIPVIVWVAPRGARAASAGTFISYAANLSYMAEATEIGAATPVSLRGEQPDELQRKVTNDAVAYIQSLAKLRDRNADWAEEAVRDGASLDVDAAVELDVVNGKASSPSELLEEIDGETVEIASGETVTIESWDDTTNSPSVRLRFQEMNLIQRILHTVTNPEIAFFLLTIGFFGLIFELYNPGIGLAGILGGVCLVLGFYALSVLPTNWAGVFLVVLAMIFFLIDLQAAGLGIWTVGGIASLVAGGLILFSDAAPALQLNPWAIVAVVVGTLVFFISVMTAALRVRLRQPITGESALIGMVGEAKTDIAPEGTVMTKGTLWRARTMETAIAAGSKVKIMATEGLVLLVEPHHEDTES